MIIQDGQTSHSAKVSDLGRLEVNALSFDLIEHYNDEGEAYNYNTGTINLTSANESALAYLKNNESEDVIVPSFIFLLGNSNSSGDVNLKIYRNPTAGTLISGGSSAVPVNRNFGSSNTLSGSFLKGAEASTITSSDGVAISSIVQDGGRTVVSVSVILPKGSSVGVSITPPASNTDMDIQIACPIYRDFDKILATG